MTRCTAGLAWDVWVAEVFAFAAQFRRNQLEDPRPKPRRHPATNQFVDQGTRGGFLQVRDVLSIGEGEDRASPLVQDCHQQRGPGAKRVGRVLLL